MEKKTAEPKSDIIVEGSVGERIYVLASGKVQILQSNRMIHTLRNGYSRISSFWNIYKGFRQYNETNCLYLKFFEPKILDFDPK